MVNEVKAWIEPELIKRYWQYKTDGMKCIEDTTQQYFYGKASAINEVLILIFNKDLSEE